MAAKSKLPWRIVTTVLIGQFLLPYAAGATQICNITKTALMFAQSYSRDMTNGKDIAYGSIGWFGISAGSCIELEFDTQKANETAFYYYAVSYHGKELVGELPVGRAFCTTTQIGGAGFVIPGDASENDDCKSGYFGKETKSHVFARFDLNGRRDGRIDLTLPGE
ncbi:DUF1036 domain-containing protein [Bradyrhizobium arachidis]|uniref:DUF1036 domain-containing protein n=1 Tax=Bradyrhizobium arachidis TaxID=858423 RepID=UPI0021622D38|nr:DUF1036 domain-containing protein [Bradyrhizobium arachidis]UVO37634.1 DUF1036 domain-containing protein [Bradyrhizobium arachidis]